MLSVVKKPAKPSVAVVIVLLVLAVAFIPLQLKTEGEELVAAGFKRNVARYLTMRDGTKIAIDIWLPKALTVNERVPAILHSTRYVRAMELGLVGKWLVAIGRGQGLVAKGHRLYNDHGYAYITVDARGSGASFGKRGIEWSDEEVADIGEVIDWIATQPWSNQKVGTIGVSYDANTAELSAVPNADALKAVVPLYGDFDPYAGLTMPGGIFHKSFIEGWSAANNSIDANNFCGTYRYSTSSLGCYFQRLLIRGIKPVDEDVDREQLQHALESRKNYDVYDVISRMRFRNDLFPSGDSFSDISPYGRRVAIESSNVAMHVVVGWLDAGTVNGALSRYLTFSNPQELVIGPFSHGGDFDTDPYSHKEKTISPSLEEQYSSYLKFFDRHLKGNASPGTDASVIKYYVNGKGVWKETKVWPPESVSQVRWYLNANRRLSLEPPELDAAHDRYKVDYSASTGSENRWATNMGGGDVYYGNRASEDEKLLTYTTEPLSESIEITGNPIVVLNASLSTADAALYVYLESVAPNGEVSYITEGQLRATQAKLSEEKPIYVPLGPYRTFTKKDAISITPGDVHRFSFDLFATSVWVEKGHRLRIAVAGHDASTFARIPVDKESEISIYRSKALFSYISMPIVMQ